MTQDEFKSFEEKYGLTIEFIRHEAHELHQSVNQIYDMVIWFVLVRMICCHFSSEDSSTIV